MISFYNSEILDIIPDSLKKDAHIQAISYALKRQNQKNIDLVKKVNILKNFDTLPEEIIDLMAAEYRTQYYSSELSIEVKRNLVKRTMLWYMKAGTTASVEELVNTIFGYGTLEEWYTYNGDPYHFKITVDTVLSSEMLSKFAKIIQKAKNVRSIMDGFNKCNNLQNTVSYASGMVRTKHIRIGGSE